LPQAIGRVRAVALWDQDGAGWQPPRLVVAYPEPAPVGQGRHRIAVYDEATAQWSTVASNVHGEVRALASMPDGRLFAAGNFSSIHGVAAVDLASFDGTAWSAVGAISTQAELNALHVQASGDLLVGGRFTAIGPQPALPAEGIARWDGSQWYSLGLQGSAAATTTIYAITETPNGDTVIGGVWSNGSQLQRIARHDSAGWHPLGPGLDQLVQGLTTLPNGDLIALGNFGFAGALRVAGIARWDGSSWHALGAGLEVAPGIGGVGLAAAAAPDGDLVVTGSFTLAGGAPADRIARWNGTTWRAIPSVPGALPLAMGWTPGGRLGVAGGAGTHFAFLDSTCPASVTSLPTPCGLPLFGMIATASGLPWLGTAFTTETDRVAASGLAFALYGLQNPALPLVSLHPAGRPGCVLLSSAEVAVFTPAVLGRASSTFVFPPTSLLLGVPIFHQFLQLGLDAQGGLVRLESSNGLRLVPGSY
jgi:hypothetical protein